MSRLIQSPTPDGELPDVRVKPARIGDLLEAAARPPWRRLTARLIDGRERETLVIVAGGRVVARAATEADAALIEAAPTELARLMNEVGELNMEAATLRHVITDPDLCQKVREMLVANPSADIVGELLNTNPEAVVIGFRKERPHGSQS